MCDENLTMRNHYADDVLLRIRLEKRWKATAWEVAGQAVARLALGHKVKRIALTPGPAPVGRCDLPDPAAPLSRAETVHIVGVLAGGEARLLFAGARRKPGADVGYQEAVRYASVITGDPDEQVAMLARLRREAESLVLSNRRAIYLVAEALLAADNLTLSGRQVTAIVRDAKVPAA